MGAGSREGVRSGILRWVTTRRAFSDITAEVARDHPHNIGLAIYLTDSDRAWAYAAVTPYAGAVLAWDGRYFFHKDDLRPTSEHYRTLGDLEQWIDRDVSASQIMMRQNSAWLPVLGGLLYPSWSLSGLASRLLDTRAADGRTGFDDHGPRPVAYFPTDAQSPSND